jgi:serine/threonine-protein kinase
MSTQIGRFEIISEIAKSLRGAIYKANDPSTNQTVALKTLRLDTLPPDDAKTLMESVLAEADSIKSLTSPNIATLYGAGEADGIFSVSMEYVQGNSIATMLARKEGFSIWDLLDIGRQVRQALDTAHGAHIYHSSLEPAKIMVQWDGTVKILGFGFSSLSLIESDESGKPSDILHYASPEQLRGEPIDARSNLFSWGAILYEMVTDQRAFPGDDAATVQQQILEGTPAQPIKLNPKIHPLASALVMKAISKSPDARFQSCQELLDELEKCKQANTLKKPDAPKAAAKPATPAKPAAPTVTAKPPAVAAKPAAPIAPPKPVVPVKPVVAAPPPAVAKAPAVAPPPVAAKPPAAAKAPAFAPPPAAATPPVVVKAPVPPPPPPTVEMQPAPVELEPVMQDAPAVSEYSAEKIELEPVSAPPEPPKKAAAAAAGAAYAAHFSHSPSPVAPPEVTAESDLPVITNSVAAPEQEEVASLSTGVVETEEEAPAPSFAVDPMMAGEAQAQKQTSFSDLEELPPLKEVYVAPPPPPSIQETVEVFKPQLTSRYSKPEKPKVPPKEVAQKAIKEIKSVPPQLMIYSIAGAVVFILLVIAGIAYHIHSQNEDDGSASVPAAAVPAPASAPTQAAPPASAPAQAAPDVTPEPPAEPQPDVKVAPVVKATRGNKKKPAPAPAPVAIVPGQISIDSTPQGAAVQVDGRTDASWVTPYNVLGVAPGPHTVSISKAGFTSETRSVDVPSGGKLALVVHLAQMAATLAIGSDPAGASVFIDGKDSGRVTPTQVTVEKGTHSVAVKKQGYLDESTTADLQPGQNFRFSPALKRLGNADDIKTVGKFKKLFNGSDSAAMGTVSIKTNPKGAQVAVNQRMLDKGSPVEFVLGPGNYVIDITMTGYKPIHRVINLDKGNKVAIDEILEHE